MIILCVVIYFNVKTVKKFISTNKYRFEKNNIYIIVVNNEEECSYEPSDFDYKNISIVNVGFNSGYFGGARLALRFVSEYQIPFGWFILCNTDIDLCNFSFERLIGHNKKGAICVMPNIISTQTGKCQNPMLREKPSLRKMLFLKFVSSNYFLFNSYDFIRKIYFLIKRKKDSTINFNKIYAVHGAFICINKEAIEKGIDFSHPAFLFCEEISLAEQFIQNKVKIVYEKEMVIYHYEHETTGSLFKNRKIIKFHNESIKAIIQKYYYE